MASITVGNELYLYQLFLRELGAGRQVMLARIEEVLLADDILPTDLGCANVREVLEHLGSFVRLTVFKKGRVYATIVRNQEYDAILARAGEETKPKPRPENRAKSWKRKRTRKDPKPAKPRPKNRPRPNTEQTLEPDEPATEDTTEEAAPSAVAPEPANNVYAPTENASSEPEPTPEPLPEPGPSTEPEAAPTPRPAPSPEPLVPSIKLTITHDPYEGLESEEPLPVPEVVVSQEPAPSPTSQQRYPQDFFEEVAINNQNLSSLYQMLPLDIDPIALLDQDWRVARSTEAFVYENGVLTFPLRYLTEHDGTPVHISLRRASQRQTGKRWEVIALDHVENVSFEGLPTTGTDVMRELAQFALLRPWDALVDLLAEKTQGASPTIEQAELRDYLCTTFHRIRCEKKFMTYDSERRGAFDTGLLNAQNKSIFMCFDACEEDPGWTFRAFLTQDEAAFDGAIPQPATYIASLSDIVLHATTSVSVGKGLARTYGSELDQALEHALRRARRDYRLATPAYDPLTDKTRLLVPVRMNDEARALVLCPQEQGFEACALLDLESAAAHARIISFDLPSWLR